MRVNALVEFTFNCALVARTYEDTTHTPHSEGRRWRLAGDERELYSTCR